MSMFSKVRIFNSSISGFSSPALWMICPRSPGDEFLKHLPDTPFMFGQGEVSRLEL